MADYKISFRGRDGAVVSEDRRMFIDDDAAIDAVGESQHPHEIVVTQGERLVAHVPAWPRRAHPF